MLAPDLSLSHAAVTPAPLSVHGGQLSAAREAFSGAPEPWIDLSTGINPHPYPIGGLAAEAWQRLPDPAALATLEATARDHCGAPAGTAVVAAPGTQALIQLLPRLRPARRVAILGFGYQEHPAVWRAAGADVAIVDSIGALASADVAVVINPNNPDGRHVAPGLLADLAGRMAAHGGLLIVDEAFAETAPISASLAPRLGDAPILILRSFGKFFGLAGLRLGFALGDAALCAALRRGLGPWAVSGPAIAVGTRALGDHAWQAAVRERLAVTATRLDALLEQAGITVVGGTSLFRLGECQDAAALFGRLGRAGILVRPFTAAPRWLRFGLPANEAAWQRLAAALRP